MRATAPLSDLRGVRSICALADPGGRDGVLITGDEDGYIRIYRLSTGGWLSPRRGHANSPVDDVIADLERHRIISIALEHKGLRTWPVDGSHEQSNEELTGEKAVLKHESSVHSIAVSEDGPIFVSCELDDPVIHN
jgi:WD40 repeat protein